MEKSPWNPNLLSFLLHFLSFWLISSSGHEEVVEAGSYGHGMAKADVGSSPKYSKLFVFGDSYVDTGNTGKKQASSWSAPYGMTFPGKPSGRFSDGRVLTDFIAKYLGLTTPVAYRFRTVVPPTSLRYGINFAAGGTGVFETLTAGPNMSRQIDYFQNMLGLGSYSSAELQSSATLVALNGNDYSAYLAKNGSIEGLPTFIDQVVSQLAADVKRIRDLGVRRVLVSELAPLGCLPAITSASSYAQCEGTFNAFVTYHNQQLQQAVVTLNRNTTTSITIIDLYSSFSSVLNAKGNSTFEETLQPCCAGMSSAYKCGTVDGKTGEKKYTVCSNPKKAFFWDDLHPTQEGWKAVLSKLINNLQ